MTAAMFVLLFACSAVAQEISMRLLDPRSGKPLRGVPVTIFTWNGPATFRPDNVPKDDFVVHKTTDGNGRTAFHLPQPTPAHMKFSVDEPWEYAGCWHLGVLSPEAILRAGAVAEYDQSKCGKSRAIVSAGPGEVVILERKLTATEKLRRELP